MKKITKTVKTNNAPLICSSLFILIFSGLAMASPPTQDGTPAIITTVAKTLSGFEKESGMSASKCSYTFKTQSESLCPVQIELNADFEYGMDSEACFKATDLPLKEGYKAVWNGARMSYLNGILSIKKIDLNPGNSHPSLPGSGMVWISSFTVSPDLKTIQSAHTEGHSKVLGVRLPAETTLDCTF